jgi:hypothetical protein
MIKTSASLRDVIKYLANQTHPIRTLTADGAIPIKSGVVEIAKASAAALTIAAPTTAQNGTIMLVVNSTAYAHVVTFTGSTLYNGTSTAKTTATFPAYVGGGLRLLALGGKWYAHGYINVTIA